MKTASFRTAAFGRIELMSYLYPIEYLEPIYRPPAESQSLLIPVTIGCSYNRCTFCAMYKAKRYSLRGSKEIENDIANAANYFQRSGRAPRKIFLCDGDALSAPQELLLKVLACIQKHFPNVSRVSTYASAGNILKKTAAELEELADYRLNLAYLGIESGSDAVLKLINKGSNSNESKEACLRIKAANWKTSQIYMLGLGGKEHSVSHCQGSAELISSTCPNFLSFLTTVPVPGTPYSSALSAGHIQRLSVKELLVEMRAIIGALDPHNARIIFRANHVSNLFPLEGSLPKDRHKLLNILDQWISACPERTYPKLNPTFL